MKKIAAIIICLIIAVLACGCSNDSSTASLKSDEGLKAIMQSIKDQVTLSDDMMTVSDSSKLLDYYGIDSATVKDFQVMMNSSGVEQDEIVMIEAVDEDSANTISEKLNARLEDKKNQMKNYLPDQYAMLQKCSVERKGLYVYMFLSDDAKTMESIFNSYFG
ncbi:MAG: DUF4358 domain-containing protein [Clostridiales bacterium]|nr:DUF4358 domain-containing protein [Clostridiales bacterium]